MAALSLLRLRQGRRRVPFHHGTRQHRLPRRGAAPRPALQRPAPRGGRLRPGSRPGREGSAGAALQDQRGVFALFLPFPAGQSRMRCGSLPGGPGHRPGHGGKIPHRRRSRSEKRLSGIRPPSGIFGRGARHRRDLRPGRGIGEALRTLFRPSRLFHRKRVRPRRGLQRPEPGTKTRRRPQIRQHTGNPGLQEGHAPLRPAAGQGGRGRREEDHSLRRPDGHHRHAPGGLRQCGGPAGDRLHARTGEAGEALRR